jgi:hypothetical protein
MAAAEVKNTKYKSIKSLKKQNGDLLEVKVTAPPGGDGEHPLLAVLKKCGYKNCMITHGELGITQAGAYQPAYLNQRSMKEDPFDVYVRDEAGFVLPRDNDNVLKDQTNLNTILNFRAASKAGMAEMLKTKSIAWEERNWKVVKRLARDGDKGGMLACTTVKMQSILQDNYFLLQDENGADYWQLYENGAPKDGAYTYVPAECMEVKAGEKYYVCLDQTVLDSVATKSGTPYDANTWAELSRDCLGWEVSVEAVIMDSDWPGYNVLVNVEHTEGGDVKQHVLPIRALRKMDPDATALFMGEIGHWILTAELQLFTTGGKKERGKSIQPLVSEFKGVMETIGGQDDLGWMDVFGDDEDDFAMYHQGLQTWMTENQDFEYSNY